MASISATSEVLPRVTTMGSAASEGSGLEGAPTKAGSPPPAEGVGASNDTAERRLRASLGGAEGRFGGVAEAGGAAT